MSKKEEMNEKWESRAERLSMCEYGLGDQENDAMLVGWVEKRPRTPRGTCSQKPPSGSWHACSSALPRATGLWSGEAFVHATCWVQKLCPAARLSRGAEQLAAQVSAVRPAGPVPVAVRQPRASSLYKGCIPPRPVVRMEIVLPNVVFQVELLFHIPCVRLRAAHEGHSHR